MFSKKSCFKTLKAVAVVAAISTVSPVILAKLGFWGASQAAPALQQANAPIAYGTTPLSYAEAIARATPSVVSIHSMKEISHDMNPLLRDPFYRYFFNGDPRSQQPVPHEMQTGIGSGVIVTKDGYILTNNHVVNDADEIKVKFNDGRTVEAKIVGSDPETDLAVLKVNLKDLPAIALGNSEQLRVGDLVFAIGNPFGVGQTVTHGIISATQRTDLGISTFENFIQTDAAINPGNSGGPLIDLNGNLIAINNAIYTRTGGFQGIGFAIPVNLAKDILSELIHQGFVTRGWLGISLGKINEQVRKAINYPKGDGALVAGIIRNGPAHTAGLRPGDVIISVNNVEVKSPNDVLNVASKLKPESGYPISVIRNGETLDFRVVVTKRPHNQNQSPKKKKAESQNESEE